MARWTRMAAAAAAIMLTAGIGSATAGDVWIVINGVERRNEVVVDIISVEDPSRRKSTYLTNNYTPRPTETEPTLGAAEETFLLLTLPVRPPEVLEAPDEDLAFFDDSNKVYYSTELPPGLYTVYVRNLDTGERWPSRTFLVTGVQRGQTAVVMRPWRPAGLGEGGGGDDGGDGGDD